MAAHLQSIESSLAKPDNSQVVYQNLEKPLRQSKYCMQLQLEHFDSLQAVPTTRQRLRMTLALSPYAPRMRHQTKLILHNTSSSEALRCVQTHPSLESSLRRYSVQKYAVAIAFHLGLEEL